MELFGGENSAARNQAIVHDGVIYITASYSRMFAIDAKTGKQLWAYEHRLADDIRPCCDVINRGAAIYGDKVYFARWTPASWRWNKDTGKVVWKKIRRPQNRLHHDRRADRDQRSKPAACC